MKRVRSKATYVRELANNTSTANLDGCRLVGGSGSVTAMTMATNCAAADRVVATWDVNHLKRGELASTLANNKRVVLRLRPGGGRVNVDVHGCNPGGSFGDITRGRKVSRWFAQT